MWNELVEYGRWAPSPHNIQNWRLRAVSDTAAELFYDPGRLLPATDPTGRFTIVGLGVFVETLAVAARAHRLDVDLRPDERPFDPRATEPTRFGLLTLIPWAGAEELAPELILRRRTARGPYDARPVPDEVLRELERVAEGFGHRFTVESDPSFVEWVLELNRDTLFYDLSDDAARKEVGRWLRFSERRARATRDGFSPASLGFPGWLLFVFFRAHQLVELPGLRAAIRHLYFRTMRGTRTVGWLDGPFAEPRGWLQAGRLLARFWLTLTKHGVHLHPFGSIITNERANARLRERIGGDPWLILRLGYAPEPARSHRRTTEEVLVD